MKDRYFKCRWSPYTYDWFVYDEKRVKIHMSYSEDEHTTLNENDQDLKLVERTYYNYLEKIENNAPADHEVPSYDEDMITTDELQEFASKKKWEEDMFVENI